MEEPEERKDKLEELKNELEDLISEANTTIDSRDNETLATEVPYTYAQGLYTRIMDLSEKLEKSME